MLNAKLSLRVALGLLALAGVARAEFRTNMDLGAALQRIAPAPAGYETSKAAARAVRRGKVAHAPSVETLPDNVLVQDDSVYVSRGKANLRADIYRPRDSASPSPILVFVHGGAWDHGTEDVYRAWGVHYAQRGYVCVAITYRLSQIAPYPAALDDVREALRWIHARAADWRADPARVAIVGQSAGAHLALLAAYKTSDAPRVQAVVDFYGPVDLTVKPLQTSRAVRKFLGGKRYRKNPALYREASPLTYVSAECPPTLIFQGTVDSLVPVQQSDELASALKHLNVPFLYDRVEGWHHAMDLYEGVNAHCTAVMDVFLDSVLATHQR